MRILVTVIAAAMTVVVTTTAQAFCGFYVARADTSLFNSASQVVLVRDDNRTVVLYPVIATDLPGVSDGWQKISIEFSIPEGCTSISLRLKGRNMRQGEWVLFDDVELVPISPRNNS